jgi:hypothetical protein
MRNPARVVFSFLLAAALTACATSGTGPGASTTNAGPGGVPVDASPEERAIAKWTLLINKNFAEAWEFQTPGARSAMDKQTYVETMNGRPVNWLGARFIDKRCETEDSCQVNLEIPFQVGLGRGVGTVTAPSFTAERWLRLDGVWYYAPAEFSPGDLRPPE